MKFYFVTPVDKTSFSHRWVVDDVGLIVVEKHYRNYPKGNGSIVDRWSEFKVDPLPKVGIDFGGMCCTDEPEVSFTLYKTKFEIPVTHIPYFKDALQIPDLMKDGNWRCKIWLWRHIYSNETRMKVLEKVKKIEEKSQKMRINFEKKVQKRFDDINKKQTVVLRAGPMQNTGKINN